MFYSPLEQFQLSVIYPLVFGYIDLSITNFSFAIFSIVLFIIFASKYTLINRFSLYAPKLRNYIFLQVYRFVSGVLFQQTGNRGRAYISFAIAIFSIILLSNLLGLSVIGFTLTAQLSVAAGLAFSLNFGLFILGFYLHGFRFLKFFVPSGVPVLLVPFMTIIEIFSYSIRSVSLSVRLFANMMAGHTLLHIISSFFVTLFRSYTNYYFAALSAFLLFAVSILEIAIAFLQAYIFLILFCIYLNDSLTAGNHLIFLGIS